MYLFKIIFLKIIRWYIQPVKLSLPFPVLSVSPSKFLYSFFREAALGGSARVTFSPAWRPLMAAPPHFSTSQSWSQPLLLKVALSRPSLNSSLPPFFNHSLFLAERISRLFNLRNNWTLQLSKPLGLGGSWPYCSAQMGNCRLRSSSHTFCNRRFLNN